MMLVCPITLDALKRFIKTTVIPKQFMENFPKLLELNLKVYTSVTNWLFDLKSTVAVYRGTY